MGKLQRLLQIFVKDVVAFTIDAPFFCSDLTQLLLSPVGSPFPAENIIGLVTFAFVTAIYTAEIKHKSLPPNGPNCTKGYKKGRGLAWSGGPFVALWERI